MLWLVRAGSGLGCWVEPTPALDRVERGQWDRPRRVSAGHGWQQLSCLRGWACRPMSSLLAGEVGGCSDTSKEQLHGPALERHHQCLEGCPIPLTLPFPREPGLQDSHLRRNKQRL